MVAIVIGYGGVCGGCGNYGGNNSGNSESGGDQQIIGIWRNACLGNNSWVRVALVAIVYYRQY